MLGSALLARFVMMARNPALGLVLLTLSACPDRQGQQDTDVQTVTGDVTTYTGSSTGDTGLPIGCKDGIAEAGEYCFERVQVPEIRFPISIDAVRMDSDSAESFVILDQGTETLYRVAIVDGAYSVLTLTKLPVRFESRVHSAGMYATGREDLVITSIASNKVRMSKNSGSAFYEPGLYTLVGGGPGVLVDVDGDGIAELITGEFAKAYLWRYAPVADIWTQQLAEYTIPGCSVLWASVTADFNGDSFDDVAYIGSPTPLSDTVNCGDVGFHRVSILVSNPEIGVPLVTDSIALDFYADDIGAGDFDGDGQVDLAVISEDVHRKLVVIKGFGDGTFDDPVAIDGAYRFMVVGNLDGDLEDEIVATDLDKFCIVDNALTDPTIHSMEVRGRPEKVADVNGDQVGDIAFASSDEGPTSLAILVSAP